jgi:hypothetical protein
MQSVGPLNDGAHLDKAKSQMGFYIFVCSLLYQMAARAMPALQVNVDQVQSNLAISPPFQKRDDDDDSARSQMAAKSSFFGSNRH